MSQLPTSLAEAVERYLTKYRLDLLAGRKPAAGKPTDRFWVSRRGTGMTRKSLPVPIYKRTRAAFGEPLPPHWFRACTATTVAIEMPFHVDDAHHVLGHASPSMTERYYNLAGSLEASRRYQQVLAAHREPPAAPQP